MNWKATVFVWIALMAVSGTGFAHDAEPNSLIPKEADPLYPVNYEGKWGFIGSDGKMAIAPRFSVVGPFYGGLARAGVKVEGQWRSRFGYINLRGEWVVEASFDAAGDFLEELAPVRVGRKWGFIDRSGGWRVQPTYERVGEFHEGLACVQFWDTVAEGRAETRRVYTLETAPDYSFHLIKDSVWTEPLIGLSFQGSRFGFIDNTGTLIIAPEEFDLVDQFSDGFAVVQKGPKWGYMDRKGQLVSDHWFDQAQRFSEGLGLVRSGTKWGYIDKIGHWVIPACFDMAGDFSEGLAPASGGDGLWGVIDKTGKFVIRPTFREISCFSDGLAVASVDGTDHIFIDKAGRQVQVTAMRVERGFSRGITIAGDRGKRVYINRKGELIAPYERNP